jgi:hypothetical protein
MDLEPRNCHVDPNFYRRVAVVLAEVTRCAKVYGKHLLSLSLTRLPMIICVIVLARLVRHRLLRCLYGSATL